MTTFTDVLLATIALGTLAFGAVYPWAYWPLAAMCGGLGVWGLVQSPGWSQGRMRPLCVALAFVAAAIGVQLIPLPIAVFRALTPGGDRFLAQYALGYSFQPPAWHALSIAPAETLVALSLFVALALLLVGVAVVAGRMPLRRFVLALALFGVAVSIIGVVDRGPVTEGQTHFAIYGFWRAEQGGHPFAPFVNPNHYAGWMMLVIALTLGYLGGLIHESWIEHGGELGRWLIWCTRPEAGRLALLGLCVLAMATALVLTDSRSGVASLGVVLVAFGYRGVARSRSARAGLAAIVLVGATFVGALAWAGAGPILAKFSRAMADPSASGRTAVWHDALHIFRDFPMFGAGLGSFGQLMLLYQTGGRQVYYTQAHNDYLQLLAEGGVLVAVAALALIVVVAVSARYRLRQESDPVVGWIRFGAVAGLIGMAAQSTVEFSLQMPAIAALFVVLAAIGVHRPSDRSLHAHRM